MGQSNVDQAKAHLEQAKREMAQVKDHFDTEISRTNDSNRKKRLRAEKAERVEWWKNRIAQLKADLASAKARAKK